MKHESDSQALDRLIEDHAVLLEERDKLLAAIRVHYFQHADDRCWMDDDVLYEAAGLPPVDRHVGDKDAMLANCKRFIERRCEGGKWPSYADLESRLAKIAAVLETAVCTVEPDKGVVMLSNDGPTHTEIVDGRPMQVYDHEYFSPLGDVLIAAWHLTKGDRP